MAEHALPQVMSRRKFLLRFTGTGARPADPAPIPKGAVGRHRIEIRGRCRACGACARACPGKALRMSVDGQGFRLEFLPRRCTDCGLCLKICLSGCLFRVSSDASPESDTQVTLAEGPLFLCLRCRVATAVLDDDGYCPVCGRTRTSMA